MGNVTRLPAAAVDPMASVIRPLRPASKPTLLRNALIPDSDGDGYLRRDVLIADGLLVKIAPAGTLATPRDGGRFVDCTHRMLLPGFFNAHTHSVQHWVRGLIMPLPLELWVLQLIQHEPRGNGGWNGSESFDKTPALAVGVSAMLCGVEALLSGCTAIMDHHYIRNCEDMATAVAAYKAVGIRAFIAPMLDDDAELYQNFIPLCSAAEEVNRRAHAAGCACGSRGMRADGNFRERPGGSDAEKTKKQLALWEECVERFHRPDEGIHVVIGPDMLEALKLATIIHTASTPEYRDWPTARFTALTLAARNGYRSVNFGGDAGGGELLEGRVADVTLWDLTALSLLPRTDPLSLLVLGSRTQAPGAGSGLDAAWVDGVLTVEGGSPVGIDLPALRALIIILQSDYRSTAVTDPSLLPHTAAAEVEYRAAFCLDAPDGGGTVTPELARYEQGRTLYDPTLPTA
ncbi:hypothetical protein T492DRAFT_1001891 [Pavlovales sp. CCMP2436]|nr:hypothetical protein T492DRAFT_1001891 [Pavlovales sp. CCMP2436]